MPMTTAFSVWVAHGRIYVRARPGGLSPDEVAELIVQVKAASKLLAKSKGEIDD